MCPLLCKCVAGAVAAPGVAARPQCATGAAPKRRARRPTSVGWAERGPRASPSAARQGAAGARRTMSGTFPVMITVGEITSSEPNLLSSVIRTSA